jgi:hypothetical protein
MIFGDFFREKNLFYVLGNTVLILEELLLFGCENITRYLEGW